MDTTQKTLLLIKEQIGLILTPCDFFTGIHKHRGLIYFNVELKERTSCSKEFRELDGFARKFNLINVEPNGVNRVSIYPSEKLIEMFNKK